MYRLNLIPKSGTNTVTCSLGDTGLRMFQFQLFNGRDPWAIDADSVSMEISNGSSVSGSFAGNVAEFDCIAEMSATAGRYFGKLKFIKGAAVLRTALFVFRVERKS